MYGDVPDNSGGAIAVLNFDKIVIDHCLFDQNRALDNTIDPNPSGGAIALDGSDLVIKNSTFQNNSSLSGAAILCYNPSTPVIENNLFKDNTAPDAGYWGTGYGGAISCYFYADPEIIGNIFYNNYAGNGGGAIGLVDKCDPYIDHNLIYNNTSDWLGGGIEIQDTCSPTIINNTIAYNNADIGGGIDIWGSCDPQIRNTILWGNTAPKGNQVNIEDAHSKPNFYYSDIQGGQNGFGGFTHTGEYVGCIDSIPYFEDTTANNYHLTAASPCIDTGDPQMYDPDGTRCDIGAFYYDQGVGIPDVQNNNHIGLINIYPNPFIFSTTIEYTLNSPLMVRITFYNQFGKQVDVIEGKQQEGLNKVIWNPENLACGIYYFRLQAGKKSTSGKLINMD